MKAFVYSKKDSKLVMTINHVKNVILNGDKIIIISDVECAFDTHQYKTTIYQN